MELTEIYARGEEELLGRKIGFTLGAVETGWVFRNDREALDRFFIRQRAVDAPKEAFTDVTVLGVQLSTPVIMSAMTMPIPAIREDGLRLVAEGLKSVGSLVWTGTPVPENLKELVALGVPVIQNVKPYEDRDKVHEELNRIQEAGVTWVGVEIDAGQGTKIGDRQVAKNCAPFSMTELAEIRKRVDRPLVFKGVLSAHDAKRSAEAGADAVMVSNHGAHTLDYLPHPLQVIEEIRNVLDAKVPVFMDGGFRRGSDVFKGLAHGAVLVGLGRPILYGLAADGSDGVRGVVESITSELRRIMIMAGTAHLRHIDPDCLGRV